MDAPRPSTPLGHSTATMDSTKSKQTVGPKQRSVRLPLSVRRGLVAWRRVRKRLGLWRAFADECARLPISTAYPAGSISRCLYILLVLYPAGLRSCWLYIPLPLYPAACSLCFPLCLYPSAFMSLCVHILQPVFPAASMSSCPTMPASMSCSLGIPLPLAAARPASYPSPSHILVTGAAHDMPSPWHAQPGAASTSRDPAPFLPAHRSRKPAVALRRGPGPGRSQVGPAPGPQVSPRPRRANLRSAPARGPASSGGLGGTARGGVPSRLPHRRLRLHAGGTVAARQPPQPRRVRLACTFSLCHQQIIYGPEKCLRFFLLCCCFIAATMPDPWPA